MIFFSLICTFMKLWYMNKYLRMKSKVEKDSVCVWEREREREIRDSWIKRERRNVKGKVRDVKKRKRGGKSTI